MTGDLLQTDIDLARRLIAAGQSDAEVTAALRYRKLDPEKARRLIASLRSGIAIQADPVVFSDAGSNLQGQTRSQHPPPPQPGETVRDDYKSHASGFPWFRVGLLLAVGMALAAIFLLSHRSRSGGTEAAQKDRRNPGATGGSNVLIEVQNNSLTIGHQPISQANAFAVLSGVLGGPTRTNQVAGTKNVIYAFDGSGVLLFSDNEAHNDSLLLYFEAVGGVNGAEQAFVGTLKIQDDVVTASTEAKSLAFLRQPGPGSVTNTVFAGEAGSFALSFAYLKSPTHLSLVQIVLK